MSEGGGAAGPVRGNRLKVWQDTAFEYDVHGNMTERLQGKRGSAACTLTRLHWDAAHQLVRAEVTRGAGSPQATTQVHDYAYDPLGRRIAKTDAFGTTWFGWDGDYMVWEQRGASVTQTIYEPNSFVPVAQYHRGQLHHLHVDHLGTPLEATNDQGEITWRITSRAWGKTIQEEVKGIRQPLRFQGQYFDGETSIHYNRFRYYDPVIGRFVGQDPIGLFGGINLYNYSYNHLRWIDPLGLAGSTIDGKGGIVPVDNLGIPDKDKFIPKDGISKYSRDCRAGPTAEQVRSVQNKPCVVCNNVAPTMVADHIDPLVVEHYRTGGNNLAKQTSTCAVQPHCPSCSNQQGGKASAFSRAMKKKLGGT